MLAARARTLELVFESAGEGIEVPEIGIDFVWVQKIEYGPLQYACSSPISDSTASRMSRLLTAAHMSL